MAKKRKEELTEKKPLELLISIEEANKRIEDRIVKGKSIKDITIDSQGALDAAKKEYWKWNDYNTEMFRRMFTTHEIAEEYRGMIAVGAVSFGEPPLAKKVRKFNDDVDRKIHRLESIAERLELIPLSEHLQHDYKAASQPIVSTETNKVFVVHGRNLLARDAMFQFLRAIGLKPIEWSQATTMSGKGAPFVGEILEAAYSNAQAVVVLITGDDESKLRNDYLRDSDPIYEKVFTPQARPNVLFEAGMAFGYHPDRTVLVEFGKSRPFSDIAGRHIIRINNSTERRQELAQRLKNAGCVVDISGTDWHNVGEFENCIPPYKPTSESEMEFKPPFYYKSGDKIPHCPICWESNGKQIHLNGPHDIPGEKPFYKCLKCNNNF